VGRILAKLRELRIADRTVVLFTSDNGGLLRSTSNAPLRAGKGSAYEGGVRVPLIVSWPGVAKPGTSCDTPAISPDLFPTILDIAGIRERPKGIDGVSLVPLLRKDGGLARDDLYWHYPHYHPGGATPYGAVRKGDLKLIEFFEDGRLELYNLREDIGEKKDLASEMPEKAKELQKLLARWRAEVGARMPTPNPDHDPKVK
jgi:arylsulfatase A-like enzyme